MHGNLSSTLHNSHSAYPEKTIRWLGLIRGGPGMMMDDVSSSACPNISCYSSRVTCEQLPGQQCPKNPGHLTGCWWKSDVSISVSLKKGIDHQSIECPFFHSSSTISWTKPSSTMVRERRRLDPRRPIGIAINTLRSFSRPQPRIQLIQRRNSRSSKIA